MFSVAEMEREVEPHRVGPKLKAILVSCIPEPNEGTSGTPPTTTVPEHKATTTTTTKAFTPTTATATQSTSPETISLAQAEHIWLSKFVPLVEAANGQGEGDMHLSTPGVEQRCKAEEGAYHCLGIVPSEEPGHFIPGHEQDCLYNAMTIERNGHIKSELSEPISQWRETFHTEAECHL
jgi:hypothetical protein